MVRIRRFLAFVDPRNVGPLVRIVRASRRDRRLWDEAMAARRGGPR